MSLLSRHNNYSQHPNNSEMVIRMSQFSTKSSSEERLLLTTGKLLAKLLGTSKNTSIPSLSTYQLKMPTSKVTLWLLLIRSTISWRLSVIISQFPRWSKNSLCCFNTISYLPSNSCIQCTLAETLFSKMLSERGKWKNSFIPWISKLSTSMDPQVYHNSLLTYALKSKMLWTPPTLLNKNPLCLMNLLKNYSIQWISQWLSPRLRLSAFSINSWFNLAMNM